MKDFIQWIREESWPLLLAYVLMIVATVHDIWFTS